eukprot:GDKI01019525.1.p2 GENE.GDKI01019525.1~~GDKI01019525.1.p2  ORF type:complete len:148 (+),score=36.30 GDKI01019525.1:1-444(+)
MRNKQAMPLRAVHIVWNLTLSLLSAIGGYILLTADPGVYMHMIVEEHKLMPVVRAVNTLFCVSKIFEFGDTMLLVLKKKPVIFLHLYHHFTVSLYAWHAMYCNVSFGNHFPLINLLIHTLMYFYYSIPPPPTHTYTPHTHLLTLRHF